MVRILALDPGGTTGWATAQIIDKEITDIQTGQRRFEAVGIWELIRWAKPHYIVCETFRYRKQPREGLDLTSMKWIGICELYAQQVPLNCTLKMQEPSEGKGYWKDDKLKAAGVYVPGKPHSMDALRHLLYFLTFKAGSTMWLKTSKYHFLNQYVRQQ